MALLDPHSFADASQPSTRHFELALRLDFDARVLVGRARLELDRPTEAHLDLDTRGLTIHSVKDGAGQALRFELAAVEAIRGARLRIHGCTEVVEIEYTTSPDATALQWLTPAQTAGGRHPFVFTQCQAIHARTVFPCQDTPRVRSTYAARLDAPRALSVVMAAASRERIEPAEQPERAISTFEMPQPIPSYLFAFAAGELTSRELGPRSRIYAEPALLDAAAFEFAEVDRMLVTAEALFGAYAWDRFDLLLMPPSFPYGGMENPRLTFLTPSLLAGDRSLVNVVAHELAHSWTGNLVTNASMNDFWLNEGFTVYAERRILEALEGEETRALHAAIGFDALKRDVARLSSSDPRFTRLRTELEGVDPDEVYSQVPYEKGYLFLLRIEALVGRPRFDAFLQAYIERFRFRSITTEDFVAFVRRELPEVTGLDLVEWLEGTGIPSDAPAPRSARLDRVLALAGAWQGGRRPEASTLAALDASEWQVLLASLPKRLSEDDCAWLDRELKIGELRIGEHRNFEIRVGWLSIAAASGYTPARAAIRETLLATGRMKYLRPLYTALAGAGPESLVFAREVFAAAEAGYHPVARGLVEGLLGAR